MSLPSFDDHASDPAQCELLGSLVRCLKPAVAVEAGTYQGHGAYYMASALRATGWGHLYTADPVPMGQRAVLEPLKEWVTYYQTDFLRMLERIPEVDFAYIDASDHSRPDGADLRWQHFEVVRAKLRPGGIICVDDTLADDWSDGEGGKSVERIRAACGANFRFLRGMSVYLC